MATAIAVPSTGPTARPMGSGAIPSVTAVGSSPGRTSAGTIASIAGPAMLVPTPTTTDARTSGTAAPSSSSEVADHTASPPDPHAAIACPTAAWVRRLHRSAAAPAGMLSRMCGTNWAAVTVPATSADPVAS